MFDELDEGTAMLPAAVSATDFPFGAHGVALDENGCTLAPDWYVTVMGRMADNFNGGKVPAMPLL
jgi:hypothetical protein